MAADMAPAAVPGPDEPAGSATPTGPLTGMLASMLTPVDPARPTRSEAASALAEDAPDAAVSGGSSAEYHGSKEESDGGGTGRNTQQRQGILRAWLLAGAARWHKGAGAHIKRLELAKAKAQAQQVKENRQVTVNRSDGFSGKGPSRSGANNKSLTKRNSSDGPMKGPKNSSGSTRDANTRQGPAGRSGSNSTGAGANSSPRKAAPEPKQTKPSQTNAPKTSAPKTTAPGSGSAGKTGAAGRDGKNGSSGASGKDSNRASTSGKQDKAGKGPSSKDTAAPEDKPGKRQDNGAGNTSGPKNRQAKDGAPGKAGKNGTRGPEGGGPVDFTKKDKAAGAKPGTEAKNDKADQTKDAKSRKDTGAGTGKDTNAKAGQQDKTRTNTKATADGKPFSTRESREAGYRDGTRAAKAAAHVRAYRDGVKDGYGDTTEIANREKERLDQAHQERKQARNEEQEQPVSGTQTSADYHQPQPISVKEVTASHVYLDGAGRGSLSRGEVRSLKAFERRLADKTETSKKVAESTKSLQAHALQQAAKVTQLLEAAKAVKGGEKLVAALVKLQDDAKVQATKAEEIHKRAARAAEACSVLLANAETRYGGIYRAVVDSDETSPAELAFYKG